MSAPSVATRRCRWRRPRIASSALSASTESSGLLPIVVPAKAGTTVASDLAAVDVALHAIGHLDQAAPGALEERHHAIHVLVARQRNLDLAIAFGDLRLGLLQLVGFRQRLVGLARDRGF